MKTMMQLKTGYTYNIVEAERMTGDSFTAITMGDYLKHVFFDNEIKWFGWALESNAEYEAALDSRAWMHGVVIHDGSFKKCLVAPNKYSDKRVVVLFKCDGYYAMFSTWKKYVKVFVEYA